MFDDHIIKKIIKGQKEKVKNEKEKIETVSCCSQDAGADFLRTQGYVSSCVSSRKTVTYCDLNVIKKMADISVVPHPLCPLGTLLKGVEALLYPCFGGHVFLFCHFLKKNRLIKIYLVFAQ